MKSIVKVAVGLGAACLGLLAVASPAVAGPDHGDNGCQEILGVPYGSNDYQKVGTMVWRSSGNGVDVRFRMDALDNTTNQLGVQWTNGRTVQGSWQSQRIGTSITEHFTKGAGERVDQGKVFARWGDHHYRAVRVYYDCPAF